MPSFCAIETCKRIKQVGDEISFHKFPFHHQEILNKWVDFVIEADSGNTNKRRKPKKITSYSSICSQHFVDSDFTQHHKRKFLKKWAVPSVVKPSTKTAENFQQLPDGSNQAKDDDEPVLVELQDPLSRDFCGLCRENSDLALTEEHHTRLVRKCLPLVNINENLLQNICNHCINILNTFSSFIDKVASLQTPLINSNLLENQEIIMDFPIPEIPTLPMLPPIKVEPYTNLEEAEKPPAIHVVNFANSRNFYPQKKCEILEIVDIKPNFIYDGTFQNESYDEDEIQILSPKQLKVELDPDDEGDNELELIRNYVYISGKMFLQDHNYSRLQDDNDVKTELVELEVIEEQDPVPVFKKICNVCGRAFNSIKKFLAHKISSHNVKKSSRLHFCTKCSKTFPSNDKLRGHMKISCGKSRQKLKEICSKIIQKKIAATKPLVEVVPKSNQRQVPRPHTCPICGKPFSGAKNLYQHKISHNTPSIKCDLCSKTFKRPHGLRQHFKSIHERHKTHICPICSYAYSLKADMVKCRHSKLKRFPTYRIK